MQQMVSCFPLVLRLLPTILAVPLFSMFRYCSAVLLLIYYVPQERKEEEEEGEEEEEEGEEEGEEGIIASQQKLKLAESGLTKRCFVQLGNKCLKCDIEKGWIFRL